MILIAKKKIIKILVMVYGKVMRREVIRFLGRQGKYLQVYFSMNTNMSHRYSNRTSVDPAFNGLLLC